jgi:hypothetical protein
MLYSDPPFDKPGSLLRADLERINERFAAAERRGGVA